MGLSTGPTSIRKCHYCNKPDSWFEHSSHHVWILHNFHMWYTYLPLGLGDVGWLPVNPGLVALWTQWLRGVLAQSAPWKKRPAKPSLLRKIPGEEDPFRIRCDLAHIWAIGVGKEFVGSALILLAGELKVWPGRSIGTRLQVANNQFRSWCHDNKQTCKINEFRLRTFKINSLPKICIDHLKHPFPACVCVFGLRCTYFLIHTHQPRLKQFPGLQGQGHDSIVVNTWLSHLCEEIDRENLEQGQHI